MGQDLVNGFLLFSTLPVPVDGPGGFYLLQEDPLLFLSHGSQVALHLLSRKPSTVGGTLLRLLKLLLHQPL